MSIKIKTVTAAVQCCVKRFSFTFMRKYIDVVEVRMSAKEWGRIKYEAALSKANLLYNNAFLRNDKEKR